MRSSVPTTWIRSTAPACSDMPPWVSDWVGIPYLDRGRDRNGLDCLGLYVLLNKVRLGRDIPDPYCTISGAIRRGVVMQQARLYRKVAPVDYTEGDAVMLRQMGFPIHVAYCIGGSVMLHADGLRGVICECFDGTKWKNRVLGVYRYEPDAG